MCGCGRITVLDIIDKRHGISMRKYYVDNIRWMIILLLVPYHAAMAWNVWGEPNYIYFESNKIISSIVVFFSPYFMPLMFFIAGISTRFALQKRAIRQYVLERAKKLLIPFIFGTVLILFLISLIAVGIILLQRKIMHLKEIAIPFVLIFLWGLPLPFFSGVLSIGGKSLVEYTYIFLVGYYIFSNDDVINKVEKWKWIFLCIGIAATVFNVYMFIWSDTQQTLLNTVAKYASEWFMVSSMLGIGKGYLNFNGKISKFMSKRSYTFYIFHFIWVVLFQYLLFHVCNGNIILLYVLPVFFAYGAALLCCEVCNRVSLK